MTKGSKVYLIFVVSAILALNSCARNRVIVVGDETFINYLVYLEQTIEFPKETEIQLIPFHGAAWELSGNIASLAQRALDNLQDQLNVDFYIPRDAKVKIEDVKIRYGDMRMDGATSYPQIALELSARDENTSGKCVIGPVTGDEDYPVNHGLFSSNEKTKQMLLPAFEEIIVNRFEKAFEQGFACVNQQSRVVGTHNKAFKFVPPASGLHRTPLRGAA